MPPLGIPHSQYIGGLVDITPRMTDFCHETHGRAIIIVHFLSIKVAALLGHRSLTALRLYVTPGGGTPIDEDLALALNELKGS